MAQATPSKDPSSTRAEGRTVALQTVMDARPDGQELGRVGGRPFKSNDVRDWVHAALHETLHHEGYAFADDSAVTLRPKILKAYVDSIDVVKTAVVVLEVSYVRADGRAVRRVYRGQQSGVNWNSGEEEVMGALKKALQTCLRRFVVDVRELTHPGNEALWRE